jgi:hypothetical protein
MAMPRGRPAACSTPAGRASASSCTCCNRCRRPPDAVAAGRRCLARVRRRHAGALRGAGGDGRGLLDGQSQALGRLHAEGLPAIALGIAWQEVRNRQPDPGRAQRHRFRAAVERRLLALLQATRAVAGHPHRQPVFRALHRARALRPQDPRPRAWLACTSSTC